MLTTLHNEARLALRSLLRQPAFLVVAILTLALGVGSVSAIYSVVNGTLLRPLPYPQAEQIIRANRVQPPFSGPVSRPLLSDWREGTRSAFSAMAGFTGAVATLSGDGDAERLSGYQVTPEFWDVMRLPPQRGRYFGEEEEITGERVVVLSHDVWQRRFGGDPGIVGSDVLLDGQSTRVLGITPAAFRYPGNSELYLPTYLPASTSSRGASFLSVVARLAPGVTLEQADAAFGPVNDGLREQFPDNHGNLEARLTRLPELLNSGVREPLLVLLGAAGLVLLISCANLANLLLARGSQRQRELAVRAALGAGRSSLLRVVLVEAVIIALGGGLLGIAIAAAAVPMLLAGAPAIIPHHALPRVDLVVVGVCLSIAVATVLLFALWPALRAAAAQPAGALQEEGRSGTGGRRRSRARGALVALEVALSLTLLVGAGLLIESLRRVAEIDIGVQSENVLAATVALSQPPVPPGTDWPDQWRQATVYNASRLQPLIERLQAMPGVESVAIADSLPMATTNDTNSSISIVGLDLPTSGQDMPWAQWRFANADYFATLGIALRRGRLPDDLETRPGEFPTSIVVNESFVRRYLPDADPIGRQVNNLLDDAPKTIIGVVADTRLFGRERDVPPEAYMPLSSAYQSQLNVALRVRGDPAAFAEPLRRTVREFDPNLPLLQVRTMDELLAGGSELRRFNLQLMMIFSVIALLLAALGLYAVIAYSVAQRRHEFGIRMSLGADTRRVLLQVVGQGMAMVGVGLALGLLGALLLGRALSSQLFGVGAGDPRVIVIVVAVLAAVALVACLLPARRATRIEPMVALRNS
jgi:putative ABC transport system permease protein